MAMNKQLSKPTKKRIMSLILIIFLSWLILLISVLSFWGLSGFDKAWQFLYTLAKQHTLAVGELNTTSLIEHFRTWESKLPTLTLTKQLSITKSFIKDKLAQVRSDDDVTINTISEELGTLIRKIGAITKLTTYVIAIKLLILLMSLPLFALAIIAGLVDGLSQRAIRTASLGRESTYVFHQVNRYFKKSLLALLTFWLILPVTITPALVFIPASILLGFVVSVAASRFKKYW
jgi:integrating conjugative element membrane protein (TIGR03747 family)